MRAKYIVLEGIQGGGKTEQIQILADRLRQDGHATYVTREPGGNDAAARAMRYITQNPQYPLTTRTEVLLYNAARSQSLETVRDLLKRDVWVICDRNYLTTLTIQYYARNDGLNYDDIDAICRFAVGGLEPDITIILDLDAQVASDRVKDRAIKERFDGLSVEFLNRMRQGYLAEAKKRRYPIVDANQSIDAVGGDIWKIVNNAATPAKKKGKKS